MSPTYPRIRMRTLLQDFTLTQLSHDLCPQSKAMADLPWSTDVSFTIHALRCHSSPDLTLIRVSCVYAAETTALL